MTLTHACHNAFADSGGIFKPLPPLHHSSFGVKLVKEMNRYEPCVIAVRLTRERQPSSNPSDLECSSTSPTPRTTRRAMRSRSHAHLSSGLTRPLAQYMMSHVMCPTTSSSELVRT